MKKVFASEDGFAVTQMKETLQRQGISCVVRNDPARTPPPEIPVVRGNSELWVENDQDAVRAEELIQTLQKDAKTTAPPWTCPSCGAQVDSHLAACWKCGARKP